MNVYESNEANHLIPRHQHLYKRYVMGNIIGNCLRFYVRVNVLSLFTPAVEYIANIIGI